MNTRMNTSVADRSYTCMNTPWGQLFIQAACCNTSQAYERSYGCPGVESIQKYRDIIGYWVIIDTPAQLETNKISGLH